MTVVSAFPVLLLEAVFAANLPMSFVAQPSIVEYVRVDELVWPH